MRKEQPWKSALTKFPGLFFSMNYKVIRKTFL